MAQLPKYTTGVQEEVHEFIWKIQNHQLVLSSKDTLETNNFDLNIRLKSGMALKFKYGYKTKADNKFYQFLQLCNSPPQNWAACIKWKIEYSKTGDENIWSLFTTPISSPIKLELGKDYECGGWTTGADYACWTDPNGALLLKISLTFVLPEQKYVTSLHEATQEFQKLNIATLQQNMAEISKFTKYGQVKLICSDSVELLAPGSLLATRNQVFAALLAADMTEQRTGTIHFDDISSTTMNILLHFFYTGDLLPTWCDPNNIVGFTYAAGKYQLTDVLKFLDSILGKEDTTEASVVLLSLANKLGLKQAEAALMQKITKMVNCAENSETIIQMFSK